MGCGSSNLLLFTVQYCTLTPKKNQNDCYIIDLIAEEKIKKQEGLKFLDQCNKKNDSKISNFLEGESFKEKTIFYYFLREKPILKTYYQSLKYQPFSLPKLYHIIILSTEAAINIPSQLIEKQTKNLCYNEFIGKELNLIEMKKKIDEANNPNITKDSLTSDNDSEYEEDEEIKEKDNEVIVCGDLNKELYDKIELKFKHINKNINNIITKNDAIKENEYLQDDDDNNKNKINTIKIFSSKFDNILLFDKLMKFIKNKTIKKFYFYDNNINADFEGWESISDFLENNYNVRYIDLQCSHIYDNHLNNLIRALTDKRIRSLNLSQNFITLEGVKIISSFLKNNKTLKKLDLSRNSQIEFKADGVKNILESLISNQNIENIDFSNMHLTGCGEYIGKFLSINKSLEALTLRNIKLNVSDFKNIFENIKNNNTIKEIDISWNNMGGDKRLEYISSAIKENKSLTCLKMDKIDINNDNYEIIFDGIEQNKTISCYTVNYNSNTKPNIMLNFFIKQMQVKTLEYEPYDKNSDEDKNKVLTLEEKKFFERFKIERPDMELIYK